MSLSTVVSKEIGQYTYQIGTLPLPAARKVYMRIQPILAMMGDPDLTSIDGNMIQFGLLGGHLKEEDLTFLCNEFGKVTQVHMSAESVLPLSSESAQAACFMGDFDSMFTWIQECIQVNFGNVIAKLNSAVSKLGDKARARQAPGNQ